MPQPRRLGRDGVINLKALDIPPGRPILAGVGLPARTVPPLPGYIRLDAGNLTLDLELTAPVRVLEGDSGWETIDRPGRVAFTAWRGGTPLRMAAPVLLDGTVDEEPIDREWGELERLARPPRGLRPPILKVSGAVPRNRMDEDWALDVLPEKDPDTVVEHVFGRGGRPGVRYGCLRATTTLILRQIIAPDVLGSDPLDPPGEVIGGDADLGAQAGRWAGRNALAEVESRSGDTLRDVAKRPSVLGDAREWRELAKLNPDLPRPPAKLKPGTRVKVPPT